MPHTFTYKRWRLLDDAKSRTRELVDFTIIIAVVLYYIVLIVVVARMLQYTVVLVSIYFISCRTTFTIQHFNNVQMYGRRAR